VFAMKEKEKLPPADVRDKSGQSAESGDQGKAPEDR